MNLSSELHSCKRRRMSRSYRSAVLSFFFEFLISLFSFVRILLAVMLHSSSQPSSFTLAVSQVKKNLKNVTSMLCFILRNLKIWHVIMSMQRRFHIVCSAPIKTMYHSEIPLNVKMGNSKVHNRAMENAHSQEMALSQDRYWRISRRINF